MEWHRTYNSSLWSPQILALSDKGFRCWMMMRGYASQHETDGFVPSAAGMMFDPQGFAEVTGTDLVERAITGWFIVGWLDEQTSAEKINAERMRVREAMSRKRSRRVTPVVTPSQTPSVTQQEVEVEVEVEKEEEHVAGRSSFSENNAGFHEPATCNSASSA